MRTTTLAVALLALVSTALLAQAPPPADSSQKQQPAPQQPPQPQNPPAQPQPQTPPAEPQQKPPAPPPAEQAPPPSNPPQQEPVPSILSRAASVAYGRRDSFPNVNIYLPEGQASVRLRKLIRNVLFESQIDYRFVNGDINTFLRYKYYARSLTYRLGIFDTIGFPDIGSSSKTEFERVRGGLLLFEFPHDYNNRYFWLIQDDRLTFGDITRLDNRKNNIYTKLGYQYGTQFDERMNAIVGETRGRITPVLTVFRELGPQKFGFAAALTESARVSTGDYKYTRLEAEALKRLDITGTSFIVSRLHGGVFLTRDRILCAPTDKACLKRPPIERYSIPQYEMFRLGGRESLKAVKDSAESAGAYEVHLTNEYFVPLFRNRNYRTWILRWNTMYGIGYVGAGSVEFDYHGNSAEQLRRNVVDAGVGAESSITLRDFEILLSVIYARTVHAPSALEGSKVRFSIRTVR